MALCEIAAGEPIVRYGVVIGYAEVPIAKGSWVHEGVMSLPAAPPLDKLALATTVPDPLPPLEGYTFEGYRQPRWIGRNQEHSRHIHDGTVCFGDGRVCGQAHPLRDTAPLSER